MPWQLNIVFGFTSNFIMKVVRLKWNITFTLTEKNIVQATYGFYRCLIMTPDAGIVHKIEHYLGATYYAVCWNPFILFVEWVGILEYIITKAAFGIRH